MAVAPSLRQISLDCTPGCRFQPLPTCVSSCVEGAVDDLSAECADCYGALEQCSSDENCLETCVANGSCSTQCLDCLEETECVPELEACAGLPSYSCPDRPPVGTGGFGGQGGEGGAGGQGGTPTDQCNDERDIAIIEALDQSLRAIGLECVGTAQCGNLIGNPSLLGACDADCTAARLLDSAGDTAILSTGCLDCYGVHQACAASKACLDGTQCNPFSGGAGMCTSLCLTCLQRAPEDCLAALSACTGLPSTDCESR